MTDSADELNLGLLLFIPYRALETRVFAALAAAGSMTSPRHRPAYFSGSGRTAPDSPNSPRLPR